MMSRQFRLRSELIGAIAKRLPQAKNRSSVPAISLINPLQIYVYIVLTLLLKLDVYMHIYIYTSALRLLALRGLRTMCVRQITQWALGDIRETIHRFLVLY